MFNMDEYRKQVNQLFAELQLRIRGPLQYHELMVSGIITLANILIESDQGKAKSKYATDVATAYACEAHRIQGMPGLSMDEVLAMFDLGKLQQGEVKIIWREEFLKAAIKFVDELNRIPAPLLSALFPPLAGEDSFYKGSMFPAREYPSSWIATINKRDTANSEMPRPFVDRFDICLVAPSPELWDCFDILFDQESDVYKKMPQISSEESLREGARHISKMPFSKEAQALILTMQRGFSYCELGEKEDLKRFPACCANCSLANAEVLCKEVRAGLSMRGGQAAKKLAQGLAFLRGNEIVEEADVLSVLPAVLRHRVVYATQSEEFSNTKDLENLIGKISTAAQDVIQIMTRTDLKASDIRDLRMSSNPLVAELAKRIRPVAIVQKPLEQHTAAELRQRLAADNLTEEEVKRAQEILEAMTSVIVECSAMEAYEPEFQELFATAEGEQFLTSNEWEEFLDREHFVCTTFNFDMRKRTEAGNVVVTMKFAEATAGDECRKTFIDRGLRIRSTEETNGVREAA